MRAATHAPSRSLVAVTLLASFLSNILGRSCDSRHPTRKDSGQLRRRPDGAMRSVQHILLLRRNRCIREAPEATAAPLPKLPPTTAPRCIALVIRIQRADAALLRADGRPNGCAGPDLCRPTVPPTKALAPQPGAAIHAVGAGVGPRDEHRHAVHGDARGAEAARLEPPRPPLAKEVAQDPPRPPEHRLRQSTPPPGGGGLHGASAAPAQGGRGPGVGRRLRAEARLTRHFEPCKLDGEKRRQPAPTRCSRPVPRRRAPRRAVLGRFGGAVRRASRLRRRRRAAHRPGHTGGTRGRRGTRGTRGQPPKGVGDVHSALGARQQRRGGGALQSMPSRSRGPLHGERPTSRGSRQGGGIEPAPLCAAAPLRPPRSGPAQSRRIRSRRDLMTASLT